MKHAERTKIAELLFKGVMPSDSEISHLSVKKADLDAIKAEISSYTGGYTLDMDFKLRDYDPENKVLKGEEAIRIGCIEADSPYQRGRKIHHIRHISRLTQSLVSSLQSNFGMIFLGYMREAGHTNPKKIRLITRHINNKMIDKQGRVDKIIRSIDKYIVLYPNCSDIPHLLDIRDGIRKCGLVKTMKKIVLNSGEFHEFSKYLREVRIPQSIARVDEFGLRVKELQKESKGA